jgi:hypothetical protein
MGGVFDPLLVRGGRCTAHAKQGGASPYQFRWKGGVLYGYSLHLLGWPLGIY